MNKMADNGWIKLHRRLKDKGYYKNSQYVHLWIHLILNANHKPKEFMWNKEIMIIKEGQLLTGRKELSVQTGIPETTIERILNLFENEHQIGQQKKTKFRVITILNWQEYQLADSKTDNRRTTDGQQTDTNKNNKKEEECKEIKIISVSKSETVKSSHNEAIKIYVEYHQKQTGLKYAFEPKDAKAIQTLLKKLYEQLTIEKTSDNLLKALSYFLNNINDEWILSNLSLTNINSKFNEILNKIKNGTTSTSKGFNPNELSSFLNEQKELLNRARQ